MKVDLSGRVAVVSGASAGLGRAIAQGLAEAGADVVIGSRTSDAIRRTANEIAGSTGRHVMGVPADVSRPEGVDAILSAAMTHFGKINILVANAGGPPPGSALALTDAQWDQAFRQNLMSAVWMIRGVVPSMKAQDGGRIITVITSGVKVPLQNLVLSNVFRSGVVALTKTLSFELAPHKILVNNLAPGRIRTGRTREIDEAAARASSRSIEEVERQVSATIPAGRYGDPREFANLAVFLASDQASYITGTTITIDGGATRAMQ
ncbi:MAG TPA: SDR family oxidoreductase [bacterium]|nr:SDR family oxidoreductase [bacterium]